MTKSPYALAVDEIQKALIPALKLKGFKRRGRSFNRATNDGLTEVINIQMGSFDPPGTIHIPGVRENLHGKFAINLGVYVPEVARYHMRCRESSWIQEYNCCIRARLGALIGKGKEVWWHARADEKVVQDIQKSLDDAGFPFLDRFSTRDKIINELSGHSKNIYSSPPRIVLAIIQFERGDKKQACELLSRQAAEAKESHPRYAEYVRGLAERLGLGKLDRLT